MIFSWRCDICRGLAVTGIRNGNLKEQNLLTKSTSASTIHYYFLGWNNKKNIFIIKQTQTFKLTYNLMQAS